MNRSEIYNIIKIKEFDMFYGTYDNYLYYFINTFDIPRSDILKIKDPKMLNLFSFVKRRIKLIFKELNTLNH